MNPRYYSEVLCYFTGSRDDVNRWVDRCAAIGDAMGEPKLIDIDFSANLAKREVGLHAAHMVLRLNDRGLGSEEMDLWWALSDAVEHAIALLGHVEAVEHLQRLHARLTQGVGDDERLLLEMATTWHQYDTGIWGDEGDCDPMGCPAPQELEG